MQRNGRERKATGRAKSDPRKRKAKERCDNLVSGDVGAPKLGRISFDPSDASLRCAGCAHIMPRPCVICHTNQGVII